MSLANLTYVFDELKTSNVTVMTYSDAAQYVMSHAESTTGAGGELSYTRSEANLGDNANYLLKSTSALIDSGTTTSATTDFLGNPIYGTPDIGAYEYQPPHTLAAVTPDKIDVGAGARIYGDGRFRDLSATSSVLADLKAMPLGGTFPSYATTTPRPEWMNITNLTWGSVKQWTASSSVATTTVFTVGDLTPNAKYAVRRDNATTSAITSVACSADLCAADGTGRISLTYSGGWSTHTFTVSPLAGLPAAANVSVSGAAVTSNTLTGNYTFSDPNAEPESGTIYQWLRASNPAGPYAAIPGAANTTYVPTSSDIGQYLKFQVTPASLSGTGSASESPATGPVPAPTVVGVASGYAPGYGAAPITATPSSSVASLPPPAAAPTATISSTADLQSIISTLTAQLNALRAQVGNMISPPAASGTDIFTFTRDLQLNSTGADVRELQQFLNTHGFLVASTGPGSPENETTYFGAKTKSALMNLQKSAGITPLSGYFGPVTRAYVNNHMQ